MNNAMPRIRLKVSASGRSRPAMRRRAGSVYVAVLGAATIVAMIGLAAVHVSRIELDSLSGTTQITSAELLSRSAVEFAVANIAANSNWRTTYVNNREVPQNSWTSLSSAGQFKFVLTDSDGNLADDANDPVTIRGIGRCGEATSVTTVLLQPNGPALDCLQVPLHSGGAMTVTGSTITCDQTVSSNGSITVSGAGASIVGDAWAGAAISGTVSGAKSPSQTPLRSMPDVATVFDYYLANGTPIDIAAIPSQVIEKVVLSAASNPYGSITNPQGVYVINCNGNALTIRNARIQATLVVINPGGAVQITQCIHWEPGLRNFPALMVQGNLNMNWYGGTQLSEPLLATNFNPSGTPYRGATNAGSSDVYPGEMRGLVYASGNITVANQCNLRGTMIAAGTVAVSANMSLIYDGTARDYPPPGFAGGSAMRISPGSWTQTSQ